MNLKDNKGNTKLYILCLVGISIVSLLIGLISGVWMGKNLFREIYYLYIESAGESALYLLTIIAL